MISRTALFLAARRAVAATDPALVDDPLAELLAPPDILDAARPGAGQVHYVLLRHRLIEDWLVDACEPTRPSSRPVEQVLILGAGLDTRYQRLSLPAATWEVDSEEMLAFKRRIMESHGYPVAPSIPRVVASLADMDEILAELAPDVPTAVVAEGFFMYHEPPWTAAALERIARYFAAPLWLAFDMLDPVILEADEFVEMNQRIAAAGEHMVGFVPAAEYEALLAGCGLSADVWDADRICRRYVGDSWQGGFPGTYVVLARPA